MARPGLALAAGVELRVTLVESTTAPRDDTSYVSKRDVPSPDRARKSESTSDHSTSTLDGSAISLIWQRREFREYALHVSYASLEQMSMEIKVPSGLK